ncbi:MAG: sensor histidine kinase [bacterium]|nr:sensor histidine kinase [bacterium]
MRRSIRSRFIQYAFIIILPLLVAGTALLYQYYHDKQSDIKLSVLAQARAASQMTTLWLNVQSDSLETMAGTPAVRTRNLPVIKTYFIRLLNNKKEWQNIFLADERGRVLVSYAPFQSGVSVADRDYFIQVKRTGRPYVSDFIASGRFTHAPTVIIAYPLNDDKGNFTGIMALSLAPKELGEMFSRLKLPFGYIISVFDRKGVLISRNLNVEKYLGHRYTDKVIQDALAGKTDITLVKSPVDGYLSLLASTPVNNTGWALITGAPERVIYGEFRRAVWAFIIFVALMLLLSYFLVVLLARRFTQPIINIEETAARIGRNQLDSRVHVESGDEVEDLAHEINRMAEELQATARSRADFLARVSHELRSPLTVIRIFLDLVAAGKLGELPERMRKGLDSALRQSQRLHQVIEDLISLSDLEARRVEFKRERIEPAEMLNDAVRDMLPAAEVKKLYLKLDISDPLPVINGDLDWLKDTLKKVIDNAIKFTDKGGVMVNACSDQGNLRIEISDTGVGISAENLKHIFERFYQVEDINIRRVQGSGMGLPIAGLVVKMHGGSIWVESPGIGQGSKVIILLPAS